MLHAHHFVHVYGPVRAHVEASKSYIGAGLHPFTHKRMEQEKQRQHHKLGYTDLMPFHIWLDIFEFNKLRDAMQHLNRVENGCWIEWVEYHNRWGYCCGIPTLASLIFTENLQRAAWERHLLETEFAEHRFNASKS